MFFDEQKVLKLKLMELRFEHRDLDAQIAELLNSPGQDQMQVTRFKKRKLVLKDMITKLESKLIPDLNA